MQSEVQSRSHLGASGVMRTWPRLSTNSMAISGNQWPSVAINGTHLAQIVDELNVERHRLARDCMLECVAAQQASGGLRLECHLWGGEGAVVSTCMPRSGDVHRALHSRCNDAVMGTCMLGEGMCIGALSVIASAVEGAVKGLCRGCAGAVK